MADLTQPNLQDPSQGGLVRSRTAEDVIDQSFWWRQNLPLTPQVFDGSTTGTVTGASLAYPVTGRNRFTWQLSGTWAGTVNIQGSLDNGTTWTNLDAGQTANGVYTVAFFVDLVRFNFTRTSGAVVCSANAVRDN